MKPRVTELGRFAQSAMTCTGQLKREVGRVMDPDSGMMVPEHAITYAGPCLVYALESSKIVEIHGWTPTVSKYAVTLPAGVDARIDDVFTVTSSPLAPDLEGIELTIIDTPLSAWQVALTCTAERVQ